MSAAALLTDLLRRGVRLEAAPDGLHYRAPRGTLTDADRASLRAHRDELLALLRAGDQPADLCLACGTSAWFWCADWPVPGEGRWLCRTCSTRPVPSLHDVAARLCPAERRRLAAE